MTFRRLRVDRLQPLLRRAQVTLARAALLCLVAALFIGGTQPGAGQVTQEGWDKLLHASYFALLTLVASVAFRLPVWALVLVGVMLGIADEAHQILLPGRSADARDLLADAVGVGIAALVIARSRARKAVESPNPPS